MLGLQSAAAQHQLAVHVGIHVPVAVKPASPATTAARNPVLTSVPQSEDISSPPPSKPAADTAPQIKLFNQTLLILPSGAIAPSSAYNKLHLFDHAPSHLHESRTTQAGSALPAPLPSPVGRLGSLICFDLRFAEPSLHLAQPPPSSPFHATPAQILLYPSAFTVRTGRAHWDVLLRARAVETQSWVVAAAQVGRHDAGAARVSYGRSTVVDPWGRVVLALKGVRDDGEEAEDGAVGQLGIVDIDLDEWERVREQMPLVRRT